MTARPRQPTDDASAARYDPDPLPARGSSTQNASRNSSGRFDWFDVGPTEVDPHPGFAVVEHATADVDPAGNPPPIRVISMKDRDDDKPRVDQPRVPLHVQLRSLSELSHTTSQRSLGHLAPPRDPRQARARQVRRYALRAGVALGLAVVIAFAIWLAASR